MKIERVEPAESGAQPRPKLTLRSLTARWYFQVFVLALAFLGGAVVYRAGVIRPAYLFVRQALTGEAQVVLPEAVQQAAANLDDEARMYQNNGLPTLYIDLPFEGYQKLLTKRAEALDLGILNTTDEDFVNATVRLQDGPKLDAKMRLKGDWTDHLEDDKWSFRIHLREDGEILHARQFSIQSPDTRNFLNEWAFHQNLIQQGVLTTRYAFLNVLLNGKLLGVYAFEENFAVELMESQGRRQGVILRFDEDLMWQNHSTFWSEGFIQEGNMMVTQMESADITTFQSSRIAENPVLTAEAETARGMLRAFQSGQRSAGEIFDVELLGRYFALHDLWSACHGVAWHNPRFYYNPVTGLLEPVAYDGDPFLWCDKQQTIISEFAKNKLFNDPQVRASYARELERISQPEYVEQLRSTLQAEHDLVRKALEVEFQGVDVDVNWEALQRRSANLGLELQPAAPVRGFFQALNQEPGAEQPQIAVDLVNLMMLPVEVLRVEIEGQPVQLGSAPLQLAPVASREAHSYAAQRLTLPLAAPLPVTLDEDGLPLPPRVEVITRLVGLEREFRTPLTGGTMPAEVQVGPAPQQPALREALQQHAFLEANPNQPGLLKVSPGVWDVQGDLILPPDTQLFVPAGTVLRFAPGAVLYTNAALHLLGTVNSPVLLTAQQDGWGGIVVLQNEVQSRWEYAVVEKTAGIERGGWVMTGGINFYRADILLDHVLLGNNMTEDAINVIHANYDFRNSEFAHTFADAFDSDFSTGQITNCYFHDITGDAFDVSGTRAEIVDSRLERIIDKGVSVGEDSQITVRNVMMDTVGIGVAAKDLSTVTITGGEIRAARFSALAAYIKKPVYGPARIETTGLVILDTAQAAVAQQGSTILLNGTAVEAVDLDVEGLYEQGVLGN